MKILIVDDEKLTREGLINSIDWETLGIETVLQSDDGIHGLTLAKEERPDIVLSDVRMPRLDGIGMAEKLQTFLPDSSIIFMSGYSDKAYLKAAIKLKAISYVEKPIDPVEVTEAILEAMASNRARQSTKENQSIRLSQSQSVLAYKVLKARSHEEWLKEYDKLEIDFHSMKKNCYVTLLVRFHDSISTLTEVIQESLFHGMESTISACHFKEMHTTKQDSICIYHIWNNSQHLYDSIKRLMLSLDSFLQQEGHPFYLIAGKPVIGIENIYDSYGSAVILMQQTFFLPKNSHLIYREDLHTAFTSSLDEISSTLVQDFTDALMQKDSDNAYSLIGTLLKQLTGTTGIYPNQVKDLYFKLLTAVRETYQRLQIQSVNSYEANESIWENIGCCFCIYELNELLHSKINLLFQTLEEDSTEHSSIYYMKEYIGTHYQNETLSIKDISENACLSSSYACTLFKSETGKTLNQYITEYRIEKAKLLLLDPRNKISEISSKVGYSDGNYFGKTFKKLVGVSPSEFREREVVS